MNKYFNISIFSPEKGQFATVFMDISRQKEQEDALRESEMKYRRLTENSPDMISSELAMMTLPENNPTPAGTESNIQSRRAGKRPGEADTYFCKKER